MKGRGRQRTEVETEHVHSLADELVDGLEIVPDVLLAVFSGDGGLAELSTRLVDAEPFQLSVCTCLLVRRGSEGSADQRSRCENVAKEHGGRSRRVDEESNLSCL